MEQHMIIDELRKELRHMKGRRDFYMKEVGRWKADYRMLQEQNFKLNRECSDLRVELNAAQRTISAGMVTEKPVSKEDPGDSAMQRL